MPIMQLGISEKSLEDVFLELTGETLQSKDNESEPRVNETEQSEADETETEVTEHDGNL